MGVYADICHSKKIEYDYEECCFINRVCLSPVH